LIRSRPLTRRNARPARTLGGRTIYPTASQPAVFLLFNSERSTEDNKAKKDSDPTSDL